MNLHESHTISGAGSAPVPPVGDCASSGASLPSEGERYIEIRGREGSTAVYRKKVDSLENVTEAELRKIAGIARCLPAAAFDALLDPATVELMLNPDSKVWLEQLGCAMRHICDMPAAEAEEFIRNLAGYLKEIVNRDSSILEGALPIDDSRIEGLIPPVVERPTFTIRRKSSDVFTLGEYVASGIMTEAQREAIHQAVVDRQNILIIGGTGSGKTVLGSTVLNESALVEPNALQIIIEDISELQATAANKVNLRTSPTCTMTDLLRAALRLRPDRIIVGEVRGPEAFDLLQAWNTGHPGGLSTLHANDCVSGLRRLKSLVSQHPFAPRDIEPDIALAVNVMVNIVRSGAERRIREIARVREYDPTHRENNGYRLDVL
jgi:type IV secretion system protein VirB11